MPPCAIFLFDIRSMLIQMAAERVVACLCSWATEDQKGHDPPVALVGGAVGGPQPVLLVHRPRDYVEGHERHENGSVRRHVGQEQEETEGPEVARVAAEAERTRPHHLVVGADWWALRFRRGTNLPTRKEVLQRR